MNRSTIVLVTAAGFATARGFLDPFRERLHEGYANLGYAVQSCSLLPYGDWQRSKLRQLWEIHHDLRLRPAAYKQAIGGNRLLHALRDKALVCADDSCEYVLVGHSGGGVAIVHAALALQQSQRRIRGLIQIGSPKCRIAENLRARTLYVRGLFCNRGGRPSARGSIDPVTRIGSWGSVMRHTTSIQQPPGSIVDIPIIGGHPDYFRRSSLHDSEGIHDNETTTYRIVWSWLCGRMVQQPEQN